MTSGASGNGPGAVQFTVDPNTGSGRTATILIATQPFVLTQDGACTFVVSPDTLARGNGASTERLDVTAPAGCAWTAASNVPWVTITNGATGSGNGQVDAAFAANTGPARTGTLTVATRTVNVSQDSGCTYTLSAPGFNCAGDRSTGSVNVTAGAGCPWSATSQAPWILVAPGTAGAGDGTVPFAVDAKRDGRTAGRHHHHRRPGVHGLAAIASDVRRATCDVLTCYVLYVLRADVAQAVETRLTGSVAGGLTARRG